MTQWRLMRPRNTWLIAALLAIVIITVASWTVIQHYGTPRIAIQWDDIGPSQIQEKSKYRRESVLARLKTRRTSSRSRDQEKLSSSSGSRGIPVWGDDVGVLAFVAGRLQEGFDRDELFAALSKADSLCAYLTRDWEKLHRLACESDSLFLLAAAHANSGNLVLGQEILDMLRDHGQAHEGPYVQIQGIWDVEQAVYNIDTVVIGQARPDPRKVRPCEGDPTRHAELLKELCLDTLGRAHNSRSLPELWLIVDMSLSVTRALGEGGIGRDEFLLEIEDLVLQKYRDNPTLLNCLMALGVGLQAEAQVRHATEFATELKSELLEKLELLSGAPGAGPVAPFLDPDMIEQFTAGNLVFAKHILEWAFKDDRQARSLALVGWENMKEAVVPVLWERAWTDYVQDPSTASFWTCADLLGGLGERSNLRDFIRRESTYLYGYVEHEVLSASSRAGRLRILNTALKRFGKHKDEAEEIVGHEARAEFLEYLRELRREVERLPADGNESTIPSG